MKSLVSASTTLVLGLLALACALVAAPASAGAAQGLPLGPCSDVREVLDQGNGKTVVVGSTSECGRSPRTLAVLRLEPAGALDRTFGDGGVVRLDRFAAPCDAVLVGGGDGLSDSGVLIGSGSEVVRLDASGRLDDGFGRAGWVDVEEASNQPFRVDSIGEVGATAEHGPLILLAGRLGDGSSAIRALTAAGALASDFNGGRPFVPAFDYPGTERSATVRSVGPLAGGAVAVTFSDPAAVAGDPAEGVGAYFLGPDATAGVVEGDRFIPIDLGVPGVRQLVRSISWSLWGTLGARTEQLTLGIVRPLNRFYAGPASLRGRIEFNVNDSAHSTAVTATPFPIEADRQVADVDGNRAAIRSESRLGGWLSGLGANDQRIAAKVGLGASASAVTGARSEGEHTPGLAGTLLAGTGYAQFCRGLDGSLERCGSVMAFYSEPHEKFPFGDGGVVTVPEIVCLRNRSGGCVRARGARPRLGVSFGGSGARKPRVRVDVRLAGRPPKVRNDWARLELRLPGRLSLRSRGLARRARVLVGSGSGLRRLPRSLVRVARGGRLVVRTDGAARLGARRIRVVLPRSAFRGWGGAAPGGRLRFRASLAYWPSLPTEGPQERSSARTVRAPRR